jgi:hypothetical protein
MNTKGPPLRCSLAFADMHNKLFFNFLFFNVIPILNP